MKWLRKLFAVREPEYTVDRCACGSEWFAIGGPAVTIKHNGFSVSSSTSGHVLCCLKCGEKWFSTRMGLLKPDPMALPQGWIVSELQKAAKAAQVNGPQGVVRREEEKRSKPKPAQLFRTPPASGE